jgi:hypothetical protein
MARRKQPPDHGKKKAAASRLWQGEGSLLIMARRGILQIMARRRQPPDHGKERHPPDYGKEKAAS